MGGNERVTMFTMNKYITPHLLEKLDKSMYVHDVQVAEKEESSSEEESESEDESGSDTDSE